MATLTEEIKATHRGESRAKIWVPVEKDAKLSCVCGSLDEKDCECIGDDVKCPNDIRVCSKTKDFVVFVPRDKLKVVY